MQILYAVCGMIALSSYSIRFSELWGNAVEQTLPRAGFLQEKREIPSNDVRDVCDLEVFADSNKHMPSLFHMLRSWFVVPVHLPRRHIKKVQLEEKEISSCRRIYDSNIPIVFYDSDGVME